MTWPNENVRRTRIQRQEVVAEMIEEARVRRWKHVKRYPEDESLRHAVVEHPNNDAPRHAYAAWMRAQDNENARWIGRFIEAQLRVADAYRADPRADVSATYNVYGGEGTFRSKNAEHLYDLDLLLSEGLIGEPMFFRGFVERVSARAHRFLEIADELFSLAPIRHLVLIGVPAVVDQLAASPHLARMRSLVLPEHGEQDQLTDDVLARLLDSPHLANITHLRIGGNHRLTPRAYEMVVTAPSLPMLSNFEVYFDGTSTIWAEPIKPSFDLRTLSYFQHVMEKYPDTGDLRDTPKPVILRPEDWIVELERKLGYVPCVHPEEHYGRYIVDIEAVTAHPIALDPAIMARRGQPVPDPGAKPSLMARRAQGLCALCGSGDFAFARSDGDPYSDPIGMSGIWECKRCGTRWYSDLWPEKA
jgi:uncharacterized protein (TIGR02996 family)